MFEEWLHNQEAAVRDGVVIENVVFPEKFTPAMMKSFLDHISVKKAASESAAEVLMSPKTVDVYVAAIKNHYFRGREQLMPDNLTAAIRTFQDSYARTIAQRRENGDQPRKGGK